MHVDKMRLLEKAVREVNSESWSLFRRIPVHRYTRPNPLLLTYAERVDLQDEYAAVWGTKHAIVNRTDGTLNWQLAKHFGVTEELMGRIFGTDGCGGAVTPGACADFLKGLIAAHEETVEELVLRGRTFAKNVLRGAGVDTEDDELFEEGIADERSYPGEDPPEKDYDRVIEQEEFLNEYGGEITPTPRNFGYKVSVDPIDRTEEERTPLPKGK